MHRIAVALVTGIAAVNAQSPIYVGILENSVSVRVAFRLQNGQWSTMPQDAPDTDALEKIASLYPSRLSWTVALDGNKIGAVDTVRPENYLRYQDIGMQHLAPYSEPPKVRGGAASFTTWMGASQFRPLIAVSQPNYGDPDHWKPFKAPANLGGPARAAFRKTVALDLSCHDQPTRKYPDDYIQVLDKAYRSSRGDVLLALRPQPARNRCGATGDAWHSVWFLFRNGIFHPIGNGLTLIDAGDYDGDGNSEVVFQRTGYNLDGYVLLQVRELSQYDFHWTYH